MSRLFLQGSPSPGEVQQQLKLFIAAHGSATAYDSGSVRALDEGEHGVEYELPGVVRVGTITDERLTLLIRNGTYAWPVESIAPYVIEIVADGVAPIQPVFTVPVAEWWPDWCPPDLPSPEAYKQAFVAIHHAITDGQMAMLRTQYLAPAYSRTATELADAAGYTTYDGANLQYGLLGGKLRDALGFFAYMEQVSYVLSDVLWPGTIGNR